MDSFFEAARNGRFPDLSDRQGLWRLLFQMTVRKAIDTRRHEMRQRRGSGACHREADLPVPGEDGAFAPLAEVVNNIPTAEVASLMTEQFLLLLDLLGDAELRGVAVARMEGYTNREIAVKMDCAVRTVERRLNLIRLKWQQEGIA
jgi:DNA-directed RNA polymerase specialized sigma24 family protein